MEEAEQAKDAKGRTMVTLETPVSYRVGSDVWAAEVVRITRDRVVVRRKAGFSIVEIPFRWVWCEGNEETGGRGAWVNGPKRAWAMLVVGVSRTLLDPHF